MILHNNILCVSGQQLIRNEFNPDGLISKSLWDKWIRDGANLVQRGGNGRQSLIEFDTIPPQYKAIIEEKFGNPRKTAVQNSFLDQIVTDLDAKAFFAAYRLDDGEFLPEKYQKQYTANASVLKAIQRMHISQQKARKTLGGNMRKFWDKVTDASNSIRETVGHKLPTSKSQFKRVYDLFIKDSYSSLISKKFGNTNTEKITEEIEAWMVSEMAMNRQSVEMVYTKYLQVANEKGWRKDIEAAAFRHRVSQPAIRQMIDLKRFGAKTWRKQYGQTFKLKRANYSNDIWVGDGTAVNWYYREGKEVAMCTTYMVMDSRSRKFLGWSMRKGINKENFEMQLKAYRMAIRNAQAKPYQVLFDNQGGHKNDTSREFYKTLARVSFATRAYRPSGKPIEQLFKDFQTLKLSEFPFWSGFGRESHSDPRYKPHMEAIKNNIDNLPSFEELELLFETSVNEWNDLNFNGKGSPNEIYAANRNPEEQPIGIDEMAELFWNMSGEKKYHPQGIYMKINGDDELFEVYTDDGDIDYDFRKRYLNQKFFVKYDPEWEYKVVELYQKHPTGGFQKVASAEPKREVSRSVKYNDEGTVQWTNDQMKKESEFIDSMDKEIEQMGYNEDLKWSNWRKKIEAEKPTMDEGDDGEYSHLTTLAKM